MAKFKSSFFSDESYNYTSDVLQKVYKDLRTNPTYTIAVCEKSGEVHSPASIRLDNELDSSSKRDWEITEKSDLLKICEGYLDYKPEVVTLFKLTPDSFLEMTMEDYNTKEVSTYIWSAKEKTLKLK